MRIKSIDFLRGLAIILVLFRHVDYVSIAHLIGWSGVDLFFVLSGFLVSGLLFKEYTTTHTIQPIQFLIRRGFKIYPLFWAVLLYVIVAHYYSGFGNEQKGILAELFFYQNYVTDNLLGVTWSLAVEEHFYIILILGVTIAAKCKALEQRKAFHTIAFTVMGYCLVARCITAWQYPVFDPFIHYTPTHLRLDALTCGVVLAYNYHFNKAWLTGFVARNTKVLSAIMLVCLLPLFFFDNKELFMHTFGYTCIYLGFAILISIILWGKGVNELLYTKLTPVLYNCIAKIGIYSYGIYLIHIQVLNIIHRAERMYSIQLPAPVLFITYFVLSIIVGAAITYLVELPMLKVRDKWFPKGKKATKNVPMPTLQAA